MSEVEPIAGLIPLADDRPIWTRQPDESARAWAWFQLFRGIQPSIRSVQRAYAAYLQAKNGKMPAILRTPEVIYRMARRHQWEVRAAEWDAYLDQEYNAALERARQDATKEVAELGANMRKAAALAVQALFEDLYEERMDPTTGQPVIVFKNKLSASAIARLAKTGVELERLALGMDLASQSRQPGVQVNVALVGMTASRDDTALLQEAAQVLQAHHLQKEVVEGEYAVKPKPKPKPR